MQLNSTLKSHAHHAAYKWPSRRQKNILEEPLSQNVWAWVQADINFLCILQFSMPKYFVLSYHLLTVHVVQCACQLTSVWAAYCKNTASLRNFLSFLFNSLQLPDFSTKLQSSNLHEEKAKLQCSVKTMHCNDGYSINKGKSSMLYVPKLNCWTL